MLDEETPEPQEEEHRRRGGPHTPAGKAVSSQNSVTHGCTSHILILHGEKQEDFDALLHRWQDAYQPRDPATYELVEQFVINKWLFLRCERYFLQVSEQLSHTPLTKWNDTQHKIYQLASRYKTTAERSASKAQQDLETYLKNRRAEAAHHHKLTQETHAMYHKFNHSASHYEQHHEQEIENAAQKGKDTKAYQSALDQLKQENHHIMTQLRQDIAELQSTKPKNKIVFTGQTSTKKLRKLNVLDQWVEITSKDGVTKTELTPSNEQLIEQGQSMDPPPELVYRRLNFPHGIPDQYAWTTDDPLLRKHGGIGIQRMSVATWLELIDAEASRADHHIGPCPEPLPRPKERGSCDCPACLQNHQLLAARSPHQNRP